MKTTPLNLLLFVSILFLFSCKKEGCTDYKATNYNSKAKVDDASCEYPVARVAIEIKNVVAGKELTINTSKNYISKAGNSYSIENLVYFLSDITVHGSNENFQINKPFYIDANDNSTLNLAIESNIKAGEYTGISLRFGLSAANNTNGKFPNAPEANMEWPTTMGGGYHYMKLEGKYDSLNSGTIKNYQTHFGPTAGNDNSFIVTLNKSFTIKGEKFASFQIELDFNQWLENPNTYDFNDSDNGIMNNQATQALLQENGKTNFFSLKSVILE